MEDAHACPPLQTPNAIPYKEREIGTSTQGRARMRLELPVKTCSAHDQFMATYRGWQLRGAPSFALQEEWRAH